MLKPPLTDQLRNCNWFSDTTASKWLPVPVYPTVIRSKLLKSTCGSVVLQKSDLPQPSMPPVLPEPQQALSRLGALRAQVLGEKCTQVQVWRKHPSRSCQRCYRGARTSSLAARCGTGGTLWLFSFASTDYNCNCTSGSLILLCSCLC